MRLAMVPLYLLCLWCVYKIGAALYSPRIGLWTAVLAAPAPFFFAFEKGYLPYGGGK